MILHSIEPVYDSNSKILILGSFPSVKSREANFFYGNPYNRFWIITSSIFNEEVPKTIKEKKDFLLRNNIALWDVIKSCEINGSLDDTIKNVTPNDILSILKKTKIERIYVNGKAAQKYYIKYIESKIGINAIYLPSSSPRNARYSIYDLINEWSTIKKPQN